MTQQTLYIILIKKQFVFFSLSFSIFEFLFAANGPDEITAKPILASKTYTSASNQITPPYRMPPQPQQNGTNSSTYSEAQIPGMTISNDAQTPASILLRTHSSKFPVRRNCYKYSISFSACTMHALLCCCDGSTNASQCDSTHTPVDRKTRIRIDWIEQKPSRLMAIDDIRLTTSHFISAIFNSFYCNST